MSSYVSLSTDEINTLQVLSQGNAFWNSLWKGYLQWGHLTGCQYDVFAHEKLWQDFLRLPLTPTPSIRNANDKVMIEGRVVGKREKTLHDRHGREFTLFELLVYTPAMEKFVVQVATSQRPHYREDHENYRILGKIKEVGISFNIMYYVSLLQQI